MHFKGWWRTLALVLIYAAIFVALNECGWQPPFDLDEVP
jgi:hypothetical protein